MAAPLAGSFKRVCLQATSRQRVSHCKAIRQTKSCRPITTTTSRYANELQQSSSPSNDQVDLDVLTKQPGVQYSIVEEPEDLRKIDVENISSLAHRELEQHKELREMVRIAAWEMPLLSQLAKPFSPPTEDQVLKWRYTTYMGEPHPAARKVVVQFRPEKLKDVNGEQLSKLLKLAGARYNPSTKTIKMSCESFETQAQNKRYLVDTINKLISTARDLENDSFADVPLDTRHHKVKTRPKFPKAWILTRERKKELEGKRRVKMLEEAERVEQDKIVNGIKAIEAATGRDVKTAEASIGAVAKQALPRGKMGKKEMGQKRT